MSDPAAAYDTELPNEAKALDRDPEIGISVLDG
jgi:hypothetical protein